MVQTNKLPVKKGKWVIIWINLLQWHSYLLQSRIKSNNSWTLRNSRSGSRYHFSSCNSNSNKRSFSSNNSFSYFNSSSSNNNNKPKDQLLLDSLSYSTTQLTIALWIKLRRFLVTQQSNNFPNNKSITWALFYYQIHFHHKLLISHRLPILLHNQETQTALNSSIRVFQIDHRSCN